MLQQLLDKAVEELLDEKEQIVVDFFKEKVQALSKARNIVMKLEKELEEYKKTETVDELALLIELGKV